MIDGFESPVETNRQFAFVDDIPGVFAERQLVRDSAQRLLESRRQETIADTEYVDVDALSTAHNVLAAKEQYGTDSEQYQESWRGLLLDCERYVGEWYRKNTSEYFEPTRHVFRAGDNEFFSHGLSIRQMTENALVPIDEDPEEEIRRINERVEEETPHILRSLGSVALGRGIVTISECTDSAINSYQSDMAAGNKHRGYRGYVPEINKLMVRHILLDPNSNDRWQTQIGLPGTYFDHETLKIALKQKGLDAVGDMDKTELHGAQFLADEDPMEFVRHLDTVATEQWCVNVYMGEQVPDDFVKDYEGYKEQARERKESLAGWSETVALFVLDLAEEDFDRTKAPEHVEAFVKNMLLTIAKKDNQAAKQMFDEKTANGLERVIELEARGRFDEANELFKVVERLAPGGGSCGAGSCGLEGITANSKEDADLRKKLGADSSDTLVKDKERACRCGKKSIVYAYNKSKVTKHCESCGATETKVTKA